VSPVMVRSHIQNLLVKPRGSLRLEAVAFAFQHRTVTSNGEAPWDRVRTGGLPMDGIAAAIGRAGCRSPSWRPRVLTLGGVRRGPTGR
jgi:hypothetical protein